MYLILIITSTTGLRIDSKSNVSPAPWIYPPLGGQGGKHGRGPRVAGGQAWQGAKGGRGQGRQAGWLT